MRQFSNQDLPEDWTAEQHALFVRCYRFFTLVEQRNWMHSDTPEMPANQKDTLAWNSAWCAAMELVDDHDGVTFLAQGTDDEVGHVDTSSKVLQ